MDDKCGHPQDLAMRFECMGLSVAGWATDPCPFSWTAIRKNKRLSYMVVDVSVLLLLLLVVGIALHRPRFNAMKL